MVPAAPVPQLTDAQILELVHGKVAELIGEDGEWTVDVLSGKKRTVRARAIAASAVAEAARSLGPDVADAITGVLAAARDRQRRRVAELEAELTAARRALSATPRRVPFTGSPWR